MLVLLATLAVAGSAAVPERAQAQGFTPARYCDPGATDLDPADVPPGGSTPARTPGVRQRWLTVGGVRTPVLESGPTHRRHAVVFLHGVLGSSQDWVDLMARVGRRGQRAIAFDLPGFGRSGPAWDFTPSLSNYTKWFGRVLSKLRVRRAHLVLHDIGGPIGLGWAQRNPRRTGRIALVGGGVLLGFIPHQIHISWASPGAEAFQRGLTRNAFEAALQEGQAQRPLPQSFLTRVYDDFDRETRCAVVRFFRGAATKGVLDGTPEAQAASLKKTFGSRRPVLVVWGKNDPYLKVGIASRQREAFPSARVRILSDSGHWPFEDDPRAVRDLVLPFLR